MPTVDFKMEHQEHSEWCWAAVAASVDRFFDPASTWCQCRIASKMAKLAKLKVKNCGTCEKPKPVPRACNQPWYLDKALKIVGKLKGEPKTKGLNFPETEKKLRAGQPVCARIVWGAGPDAHFVVISGCETASSGNRWVDVEDSFAGSSTWLYDEFRVNYQYSQGHWSDTYPLGRSHADALGTAKSSARNLGGIPKRC